jgi:biopolymer transport protein ExbD
MRLRRIQLRKARIEIIPMIDTMFFLLVFFMLSSLTMSNLYTVPVTLPEAKGTPEKSQEIVMLTITKDRKIYFNKDEVSSVRNAMSLLSACAQNGRKLSVIINIDQSVEYRRFVELFNGIQQSGIPRISLAINQVGN